MHVRDLVKAALTDIQPVDCHWLDCVKRAAAAVCITTALPALTAALARLVDRFILVHLARHLAALHLVGVVGLPASIAAE